MSNKSHLDYRLTGEEAINAEKNGLAEAVWYTSPVNREDMKNLMVRKNGPAIRDTMIWFGILTISAVLTVQLWGSWWFLIPYIIYSVVYASTSDSRWHESSHGTAFKTDWMNNALYEISSFMVFRQSTVWRWSHTRHHSDTLVRGRDPEIAVPRPPDFFGIFLNLFAIKSTWAELKKLLIHASGRIDKDVSTYLPESENRIVIRKARIYLLIYLAVISSSIYFQTILPLLFVGIPTFVGSWLMPIYGMTQHAGLEENVLDHRVNCRTVYMNRIHRFLYWNMNYHVEHHMFPMVPYHALPRLHQIIKDDCAVPKQSIIDAWSEIIPALIKQRKDPFFHITRDIKSKNKLTEIETNKFVAKPSDINSNGLVKVCSISEIEKGEVIRFDLGNKTLAIYRIGENRFYASDGICTHGNSHLSDGMLIGDYIECPKHNGRFDVTDGSVQRQPVCIGLTTYPVVLLNNELWLNASSLSQVENQGMKYRVVSNHNVATYIKELTLEPINAEKFQYAPGDYVQIEIPEHQTQFNTIHVDEPFKSEWKKQMIYNFHAFNKTTVKRNYSLASNPDKDVHLKFNVRIALPPNGTNHNAGVGSSYVFNLKKGDDLNLFGPYGNFHVIDSKRELVFVGGGAGMAPLRSQISNLLESKQSKREMSFWYGARTVSEIFYKEYFENLEKDNRNFAFNIALSESKMSDNWDSFEGYIHEVLEYEYLKNKDDLCNIEFYLCGPPVMTQAVINTLSKYKIPKENILYDEF